VIATALVAAVDDGRHFKTGRELAACIGLVPRQFTTGGKPRPGGIGRRANHDLRRQMIHGARAVMFRLAKHDDRYRQRDCELLGRAPRERVSKLLIKMRSCPSGAPIAWTGTREITEKSLGPRNVTATILRLPAADVREDCAFVRSPWSCNTAETKLLDYFDWLMQ
jgi:Transposase IS116/IS110/IS902 family